MGVFEIDRDKDHAGVSTMRGLFDAVAQSPVDVCPARVRTAVVRAKGQPLRLLRQTFLYAGTERTPRPS